MHLVVYEHRFGLDISVHATAEHARQALVRMATTQCARDPAIRQAVCARFGNWPASGFSDGEIEALLDDWSELSDGERLWTTECAVHGEVASAEQDGDDAGRTWSEDGPVGVRDFGAAPMLAEHMAFVDVACANADRWRPLRDDTLHGDASSASAEVRRAAALRIKPVDQRSETETAGTMAMVRGRWPGRECESAHRQIAPCADVGALHARRVDVARRSATDSTQIDAPSIAPTDQTVPYDILEAVVPARGMPSAR